MAEPRANSPAAEGSAAVVVVAAASERGRDYQSGFIILSLHGIFSDHSELLPSYNPVLQTFSWFSIYLNLLGHIQTPIDTNTYLKIV
jgi:hypothetical protein